MTIAETFRGTAAVDELGFAVDEEMRWAGLARLYRLFPELGVSSRAASRDALKPEAL